MRGRVFPGGLDGAPKTVMGLGQACWGCGAAGVCRVSGACGEGAGGPTWASGLWEKTVMGLSLLACGSSGLEKAVAGLPGGSRGCADGPAWLMPRGAGSSGTVPGQTESRLFQVRGLPCSEAGCFCAHPRTAQM